MAKKTARALVFTYSEDHGRHNGRVTRSMAAHAKPLIKSSCAEPPIIELKENDDVKCGMYPQIPSPDRPATTDAKKKKALSSIYTSAAEQRKLNSNDFQAYLEYMWMNLPANKRDLCTYLDCLWFSMYMNGDSQKAIKWVKDKGVFSKSYTLVPIVCWGHWSLLVLCNFGAGFESLTVKPRMILLDSLHKTDPLQLETHIRRFIVELLVADGRKEDEVNISSIPLEIPDVPQQRDGEECGIFVLLFINLFVQIVPQYSKVTKEWFTLEDVDNFEKDVRSFLAGEAPEQNKVGLLNAGTDSEKFDTESTLINATRVLMPTQQEGGAEEEKAASKTTPAKRTPKRRGQNSSPNVHVKEELTSSTTPAMRRTSKRRGPTECLNVHAMEVGQRISVQWNDVGQPVGAGGRSLRSFLGSIARNPQKLSIQFKDWRKVPRTVKDDVFEYVQRKYDIPDGVRRWVLKSLGDKWRYWKYAIRKKHYNHIAKGNQVKCPEISRVDNDQWRHAVLEWSSVGWQQSSQRNKANKGKQNWFHCAGTKSVADMRMDEVQKNGVDLDRAEIFEKRHTRKDGRAVNDAAGHVIEKLKVLRKSQPSTSSSVHQVARSDDIFTMVLGKDKGGVVRGVGTGPTPSSLWRVISKDTLRAENTMLMAKIVELEASVSERMTRMEGLLMARQNDQTPSPPVVASSAASVHEGHNADLSLKNANTVSDPSQLVGKKAIFMDMEGNNAGTGFVMGVDPEKVVMGRKMGFDFCEVSLLHTSKPDTPLIVKDQSRIRLKDAVGSHILWLKDYVFVCP